MSIPRQYAELVAENHIEQAYVRLHANLRPHFNAFEQRFRQRLAQGSSGDPTEPTSTVELHTWLRDRNGGDVHGLLHTVKTYTGQFADTSRDAITQGKSAMAEAGNAEGHAQVVRAVQPVVAVARTTGASLSGDALIKVVRTDAIEGFVQRTLGGGPLADILKGVDEEFANAAYRSLIAGLREGVNPRAVVDDLQFYLGGTRARALTVARTEMLSSYRYAQLANFRANSDVVTSWSWSCAYDSRTCGACIALDGSIHPLDEDMSSHANCRCSALPIARSYADILGPLGIDTSSIPETSAAADDRITGSEWLSLQDTATQDKVLGLAGGALYRSGDLSLADLVGKGEYGYYQKSLKALGYSYNDLAKARASAFAVSAPSRSEIPPTDITIGEGSGKGLPIPARESRGSGRHTFTTDTNPLWDQPDEDVWPSRPSRTPPPKPVKKSTSPSSSEIDQAQVAYTRAQQAYNDAATNVSRIAAQEHVDVNLYSYGGSEAGRKAYRKMEGKYRALTKAEAALKAARKAAKG